MHGWQDNAATFDPLMNLLPNNLSVLAIDLPGHGLSSHYPPGVMYHFSEDIAAVRRFILENNWKNITLLGHSMGSIYSFVYAAIFPLEVEKIIGFDILRPVALDSNRFLKLTGKQIDTFINFCESNRENPDYSVDDLIERQHKANDGSINREACKILQTRGTYQSKNKPGFVTLSRDIRVTVSILGSLPHEFLLELASRIKCEVLNIKFKKGPYYEKKEFYEMTLDVVRKSAKKLEYHEVEGTHHAHLNNPENVAQIVANFLKCGN